MTDHDWTMVLSGMALAIPLVCMAYEFQAWSETQIAKDEADRFLRLLNQALEGRRDEAQGS